VGRRRPGAPAIVLALLCLMYGITYIDRVNVSTAAAAFRQDLHLSNTEIGIVFSAFAYPYLFFQVFGGWLGDRFGARVALTVAGLIWSAGTMLTGAAGSLASIIGARLVVGFGEGAAFPLATRAMSDWVPPEERGFAQGITHAAARLGNAVTPPIVAALIVLVTWRGSFVVLGAASLVWAVVWAFYFRDDPARHPSITSEQRARLQRGTPEHDGTPERGHYVRERIPWGPLVRRMLPVTIVYFCYGWTLWLYLSWIPSYFAQSYHLNLRDSSLFAAGVFFGGVFGDTAGGIATDRVFTRTGSRDKARRNLVVLGFLCSLVSMLPILLVHDVTVAAVFLSAAFFFAEFTIGPMWAIPMDVAPRYAGTASGLMNTGSALAASISPVIAGYVIDVTGVWELPFLGSIVLLLVGAVLAFRMRPDEPLRIPTPAGEATA
jgi:MFS family permease